MTRPLILEEVDSDIAANKLYLSDRLGAFGRTKYPALLREAVLFFDEVWLAEQLREHDCFNPTFQRKNPKGGVSEVRMPSNAPEMLAEGEYNRFYMRGLCRRAMNDGLIELIVYRAKPVSSPRAESESKLGMLVAAKALLDDLRSNVGIDTFLGLPAGPNSGLCVKLGAPSASHDVRVA
jgi:hypothetical protein